MSLKSRLLESIRLSPQFWSIFAVIVTLLIGNLGLKDFTNKPYYPSFNVVKAASNVKTLGYGGPNETDQRPALLTTSHFLNHVNSNSAIINESIGEGSLIGYSGPSLKTKNADSIQKYRVKKDDTLASIAFKFNISVKTLIWANPGSAEGIKEGQSLLILPVSGVLHETKDGDSLKSLANSYHVKEDLIIAYNPQYQELLSSPNSILIIPHGEPITQNLNGKNQDVRYYLTLPTRGWNWGNLHYNNAVDIANSCGSSIYAAQEGLVIEESGENNWNDGYGNYIVLEHPNGIKTKYAHNKKNLVKVGDYIPQGVEIAEIGNTGKTHGVTGCHLHFEVIGAKNPLAINL